MNPKTTFQSQLPDAIFLEHRVTDEITNYLRKRHWLTDNESVVAIKKPGEGNMNFVARVTTDSRSFVVKQARPWVYKFPQVAAPLGRGKMEATFYQLTENDPVLQRFAPTLIGFDGESYVLAQEDLGEGTDFTFLYTSSEGMTEAHLEDLLRFLSHLHRVRASPGEAQALENRAMRELNHEHIFRYPYAQDNGMDLDAVVPGLQRVAHSYHQDSALKRRIAELGDLYLQNGDTLLHGDYYPGSWLRVAAGVRVIDPEFGFFGRPEFDVGVMLAHALITATDVYSPTRILTHYQAPTSFDEPLAQAFAGTEILRRLLGLAQLPLSHSLERREALLRQAAALI